MKQNLLDQVYSILEYDKGDLVSVLSSDMQADDRLDIGEWLSSCYKINKKSKNFSIDSIFFLKDNPAVIFGVCSSNVQKEFEQAYINVWNLARPQYFFFEINGELRVYDFSVQMKICKGEKIIPEPIAIVKTANDILQKLQNLSRNKIEAGIATLSEGSKKYKADDTLINDIKKIRTELMNMGLNDEKVKYAHSIMGRSIFIRYLEDRGILTNEYFENLASQNREWKKILEQSLDNCLMMDSESNVNYIKCLRNKEFTYALYKKLSHDFNGDMFPIDEIEENIIQPEHLIKISDFLQGKFDEQLRLFFWAYQFDIIPMELISNLYEEFYHKQSNGKDTGTHYTPLSLVELMVKQTLTIEILEKSPIVLDPCCGSGVFLVESFKRIVRFHMIKNEGKLLKYEQLKNILKTQIRGIERNEEALRVAAFSLYVAFLDFQDPPSILEQMNKNKYLPNLKCDESKPLSLNILLCADAFTDEADLFAKKSSVNIIIGNPPWEKADKFALEWCTSKGLPIGDKECSQAFIWRVIEWAEQKGLISLLLPIGIFSKTGYQQSRAFREKWLSQNTLLQVINFAHSRSIFFKNAIAPFATVLFCPKEPSEDNYVSYWSVKMNSENIKHQYIILGKSDMHYIRQRELLEYKYAWKTLWWGRFSYLDVIKKMKTNASLSNCIQDAEIVIKQGFTRGKGKNKSVEKISKLKMLSLEGIVSYGKIDKYLTDDVPVEMHTNFSSFDMFEGNRIIVKRGISNKGENRGEIVARFENEPFSFTTSIHCIKIKDEDDALMKSICAILLSSVAKYYFFLTCSGWGMWHDEIHRDELEQFPIPSLVGKNENKYVEKLALLMDEIKEYEDITFFTPINSNQRSIKEIREDIDEIVYDLYQLTENERDLVKDMCSYGLDLFYKKSDSYAMKKLPDIVDGFYGVESNLHEKKHSIYKYIEKIVSSINGYLSELDAELEWRIYRSKGLIAILFLSKYKSAPVGEDYENDNEWETALDKFEELSRQKVTDNIYIEGSFVGVSETCIAVIKKDEQRNWTASMAWDDLNSILLKIADKRLLEVDTNE